MASLPLSVLLSRLAASIRTADRLESAYLRAVRGCPDVRVAWQSAVRARPPRADEARDALALALHRHPDVLGLHDEHAAALARVASLRAAVRAHVSTAAPNEFFTVTPEPSPVRDCEVRHVDQQRNSA